MEKKLIDLIIEKAEADDWAVKVTENEFSFRKSSPAGQDFGFEVTADDLGELIKEIDKYYDCYDCSEEAYLWLDDTGHGKNGAPYEMCDVYEDMKACENMIWELKELLDEIEEDEEDE